ncbi:carbohydrate kinase family protein [Luteimonas sp. 22616]|uniref:carbohydrate kinase family protein n=1 Tax=Luteimonas sp. 22616 TaxID=3453951 RepID=UPI003F844A10
MATTRTAIACFGEALIDFLASPSTVPGAARQFTEHAGGAPANVAVGVARLGGDARFVGMLSTDMFGDFLLAQFHRYGVDVAQVRRTDAARTALAFVSLAADGERSFNFYRPPAADLLFRPGDFDGAAFDDLAILHACSNSLTAPDIADTTLHGMRLATTAGALVSFDLNLRPALWPRDANPLPALWRALECAHLVKLSREELAFLAREGGEGQVAERLFAHAAQAVVITDGAAPVRWWTRDARGTAATFGVDPIDTTAAGDAFVAGLLHRIAGHGLHADALAGAFADADVRDDLLRHAAATGALATTRFGAFAAMPDRADVQALLENAP